MGLGNLFEIKADFFFSELQIDLLVRVAVLDQILVVLVLLDEFLGHITPHDLHEAVVLCEMFVHFSVQILETLLNFPSRILFDNLA